MPTSRAALPFCFLAVLSLCAATPAFAVLSATADLSTSSTSAPYNYTIDVHNTGTTNIGTFWFAWDANSDYNFLPSVPTNISAPTGWIAPVTHVFSGDRYGIEYYNISGSSIAPGATGQFHFTSPDSPATLTGDAWISPFKITSSFVYIGFPETDPGFRLTASVTAVPEPASLVIALIALAFGCLHRRR
ncbi:MAG TPA: PEP-CTERM sorting domain-containing protein [Lacipirellulaceae bacterium]|nr:PEP-CTERM sorting domain-containing protein [Lacipirellulaceae bacterium]